MSVCVTPKSFKSCSKLRGPTGLIPVFISGTMSSEFCHLAGRHLSASTLMHSFVCPVPYVHDSWFPGMYNCTVCDVCVCVRDIINQDRRLLRSKALLRR